MHRIFLSSLDDGHSVAHVLRPGRHAWLQVLRGEVTLNSQPLTTGDGAAVVGEHRLQVVAQPSAEIMLFDLA